MSELPDQAQIATLLVSLKQEEGLSIQACAGLTSPPFLLLWAIAFKLHFFLAFLLSDPPAFRPMVS
jgi:hypothetical protein